MLPTPATDRSIGGPNQRSGPDGTADCSAPGTVVFSVDAELGWGYHDWPSPPLERIENARRGWRHLLRQFDEFDVPATWAVVGHLFLDECDGRHADHPAPAGWFDRERGEWADRPDLRFGRGLIDRIETAGPAHELACHGFSHIEFGEERTTSEMARAELRAWREAAGREFESFVFPRNNPGHWPVLAESGLRCYRGLKPAWAVPPRGTRRAAKAVAGVVGRAPPLVVPHRDAFGMVSVPASLYLYDFEGPVRALLDATVGDPVVRRVRRGIDAAARTGGVLHLWLHPNNLYRSRHVRRLRSVLQYLAARRDEGRVTVRTMAEIAETV